MKATKIMNGLDEAQELVAEFHRKMDIDYRHELTKADDTSTTTDAYLALSNYTNILETQSRLALLLYKRVSDVRLLRMHLLMEELAELSLALREGDTVRSLDALTDILVVAFGAGVAFDLPLGAGFVEVMRSNLTKEKQKTDPDAARLRDKGPNYDPPNLAQVLVNYSKGAK